jgi:hypothetical protein
VGGTWRADQAGGSELRRLHRAKRRAVDVLHRCEVLICASSRHIAACDDYACRKLDRLLVALSPVARANLEALRAES